MTTEAAPTGAEAAAAFLETRGIGRNIDTGVILGTGLGSLADSVADPVIVPYEEIPGFGTPQVSGHAGRLVVGQLEAARVAFLDGRIHYYESGDPGAMKVALQTIALLGVRTLIITNSAGSLHSDWYP